MYKTPILTIDVLKNAGIEVDWDVLNDSLKNVIDTYQNSHIYNIEEDNVSLTKIKESVPYLYIVQTVDNLMDNKASEEQVALFNYWLAKNFFNTQCRFLCLPFLEKSFAFYKEHPTDLNYSFLLDCGQSLYLNYEFHTHYKNALEVLKYCLGIIEKHEGGKGDFYCRFLRSTLFWGYGYGKKEYDKHLKWFISDYTISDSDPDFGIGFYQTLCELITPFYNDKLSDEEHAFWFESYLKYKKLEIKYRSLLGAEKEERGCYDLGVIYTVEYYRTKNPEYYEQAKKLLTSVKGSLSNFAKKALDGLTSQE